MKNYEVNMIEEFQVLIITKTYREQNIQHTTERKESNKKLMIPPLNRKHNQA